MTHHPVITSMHMSPQPATPYLDTFILSGGLGEEEEEETTLFFSTPSEPRVSSEGEIKTK